MSRSIILTNALLWAAIIVAAAILDAPVFLTLVLLPAAAVSALLVMRGHDTDCAPVRVKRNR